MMYKYLYRFFTLITCISMLLMGCSENPSHSIHDDHGSVKVQLQHLFDSLPFAFNTEYDLPNGEKIRSTMLKYYMSNISFEKADG